MNDFSLGQRYLLDELIKSLQGCDQPLQVVVAITEFIKKHDVELLEEVGDYGFHERQRQRQIS